MIVGTRKPFLTKQEMLEMRPGTELDELVAVKVMGYQMTGELRQVIIEGQILGESEWLDEEGNPAIIPSYSTDVGEAWKVVERLDQEGWKVKIQKTGEGYEVQFHRGQEFGVEQYQVRGEYPRVFTVTEAIVKCALLVAMSN